MAHDIFISYSSKDKPIADAVCAKLEERHIRAWIAPRDVPIGKNFAESIIEAINVSKVFVLIWSANTNTSEHILNEVNQAFDQGITIIPFRLEAVEPNNAMRYYIGRTHWMDAITPPLEKHIDTLADTILAFIGRPIVEKPEALPAEPIKEEVKPLEQAQTDSSSGKKGKAADKPLPERTTIRPAREKPAPSTSTLAQAVTRKKGMLIPIAAGVLGAAVLGVMALSGVFRSPERPEETPIPISQPAAIYPTLIPTLSTSTTTVQQTPTPNKGIQDPVSGHWYRVIPVFEPGKTMMMKWDVATKYCMDLGGHLATIESASENWFVYNNVFEKYGGRLGAIFADDEKAWVWVTGEGFSYTNWAEGQPSACENPPCMPKNFLGYDQKSPAEWFSLAGDGASYICEFEE